jgi:ribosomal protein S12 methylthiotransferase accessory factor
MIGDLPQAIVKDLKMGATIDDLTEKYATKYSAAELRGALWALSEIGYLRPLRTSSSNAQAWWDEISDEKSESSVTIQNLSGVAASQKVLHSALHSHGVSIQPNADFQIVLVDDYLTPKLRRLAEDLNFWLPVKMVGHTVWIGPIFRKGKSPCWDCLAWWLRMHRSTHLRFCGPEDWDFPSSPSPAWTGATLALAAGMIATAVSVILSAGRHEVLENTLLTFDTRTLRQQHHEVRTVPSCPACRGPAIRSHEPLSRFVSPFTGIVDRIESSESPAFGFFHASAEHVHAIPRMPVNTLMKAGRSFGKSATLVGAVDACIAEAIERYSCAWRGDERIVRGSANSLNGIAPNVIHEFSAEQLRHNLRSEIPSPLDPDTEIAWVEARSLLTDQIRYLPAALVYFAYPLEIGRPYAIPDSVGCAAGPTLEEAMARALLELIERDALAIWWYNRLRRPSIEISGITSLADAIVAFKSKQRTLQVIDITSDTRIPACVAIAANHDGSLPFYASAAAMTQADAASKAVAELAQISFWATQMPPDEAMLRWHNTANTQNQDFAWLKGNGALSPLRSLRGNPIESCLRALAKLKLEAYWVDLTRAEVNLPVVRVVVPGLRHPWSRLGPGRLYDVPVRLGWLDHPLSESQLNPFDCTL